MVTTGITGAAASTEHLCLEEIAACCIQFEVGGIVVELEGDSVATSDLGPALQLFRVAGSVPDIQIHVDHQSRFMAGEGRPLFDSGTTWRLYDLGDNFQFDFRAPAFGDQPYRRLIVDRSFRHSLLQISEEAIARFPGAPSLLEYPLDELLIMHRLTQERAIELHGCGIVRSDGIGNLFVGHSGAGKSTTTRLWTERENVEVLSDDRIIVRRDESAAPSGLRMYGTPWHGEAHYASPGSAPVTRIFILEHGFGNVLTRLSPSPAVAELFARSFVPFHRHEFVESALSFLLDLVSRIPVYRFSFEPDSRAVETILKLHD
jgi:hypothetical protein